MKFIFKPLSSLIYIAAFVLGPIWTAIAGIRAIFLGHTFEWITVKVWGVSMALFVIEAIIQASKSNKES